MRKQLAILAAFAAAFAAVPAAEQPMPEFGAKIILSKAVNVTDQFVGILPERPPFLPRVGKVVCGEPFRMNMVFHGAEIKDGAMVLAVRAAMTDPAGKKTEIFPDDGPVTLTHSSGAAGGVFLLPQEPVIFFEPHDPKGSYRFELELTDRNSGKTARASAAVEYADRIEAAPGVKAFEKISQYYRAPCPEYILPAFREFLANLPQQKRKEGNNFNPLPQLAFFYFLLRENPQCVKPFADMAASLADEEKYLGQLVLHFAAEKADDFLSRAQRESISRQFPNDPFVFEKAEQPWQLDVCWAEFLVRGTRAPVMKAAQALGLASDALSVAEYRKLAAPTAGDRRKLLNGLTVMAARWSIGSLARQHPLIKWYLEAALRRGEIKDSLAAALAAQAVGLQVKVQGRP